MSNYFVKPDGNGGIADAVNYEQELTAALTEAQVAAETDGTTVDADGIEIAFINEYREAGYHLVSDSDYAKLTDTSAVPAYSLASDGSTIYQTYEGCYLIKPDGAGSREDTKLAVEYSKTQVEEYTANGYFLIGDDDFQKLIGNGDVAYSINSDGTLYETPEYEPTLEEAQEAKLTALKTERDTLEVEPITYSNGYSYDYDEKARDRINAAIIALELQGDEATISWTTADNEETTLTAADLKGIIAAVAVRSNLLHVACREAREKIEAATTVEEVNAVTLDYSTTETAES